LQRVGDVIPDVDVVAKQFVPTRSLRNDR
jgi:hypothetical protein